MLSEEYDGLDEKELITKLMNDYGDDLKRIAYAYMYDLSESEDIIQEVFLSCYRNLHSFRRESSYKTWLIRMTINTCKDYRKRWSFRNLIYRQKIDMELREPSAEQLSIQGERSRELIEAISGLPSKFKEVLILYYYEELTMKEISETLELSINTVKSRLLRGKQALHNKLEGSGWSGGV